ncbi:MAG TPA: VOC family protein [Candidatus Binatia bacterium]|nr:VOC family protein [Candidatus Binatia bacterium]
MLKGIAAGDRYCRFRRFHSHEEITMAVKPIPDGYHTVTPYITVDDAGAVIDFLKKAFDAQETFAMRDERGRIQHAEVKVGTSMVMLGGAHDQWKARPANFYLYVEDCDAAYSKAIAAGAKSLSEPATQFYGDRHGGVTDSQGNNWWIATHVEDVAPAELERRAKEWQQKQAAMAGAEKTK